MPLVFGPDDLDAQARLRDAFDPWGAPTPTRCSAGSRCGELASCRRGVGVTPDAEQAVAAAVGAASTVVPVGAGTQREVGGPVPTGTEWAPLGHRRVRPAELTVDRPGGNQRGRARRGACAHAQECVLDPATGAPTSAGCFASACRVPRRLR